MKIPQLENLLKIGKLKREPADQREFDQLISSGVARLKDAANETLNPDSRFDLAYNAAHSLALAALRWHGYRPNGRYLVFQTLGYTLEVESADWRVLDDAHNKRNRAEYYGKYEVTESLIDSTISVTEKVAELVQELGPTDPSSVT